MIRTWMKGTWWWCALIGVLVITGAVLAIVPAVYMGRIIDTISGGAALSEVTGDLVSLVVASLAGVVVSYCSRYATDYLGQRITAVGRRETYRVIVEANPLKLEAQEPGRALAALTSDVPSIGSAASGSIPALLSAVSGLIVASVVLVTMSWQMSLVVLAGAVVVALLSIRFKRISGPAYSAERAANAASIAALTDNVYGAPVTRMFAREAQRQSEYEALLGEFAAAATVTMKARNSFFPSIILVNGLCLVGVIWVGGVLVDAGSATVGAVTTFVLTLNQVFGPVQTLSSVLDTVMNAAAASGRLRVLHSTSMVLPEPENPVVLPERGVLRFEEVDFAYAGGSPVLEHLTLAVAPGEKVALTGVTGAGKSTIARLAARWADPQAGQVSFGGVNLCETSTADLHGRIVFVPQELAVFPGSVSDNLTIVAEASEQAQRAALTVVGLSESVLDKPMSELSVPECRLVALARVCLLDPAVVILDEATADADPVTAQKLETALDKALVGRTVLVIAHRRETALRCDRILVVEDGEVREERQAVSE